MCVCVIFNPRTQIHQLMIHWYFSNRFKFLIQLDIGWTLLKKIKMKLIAENCSRFLTIYCSQREQSYRVYYTLWWPIHRENILKMILQTLLKWKLDIEMEQFSKSNQYLSPNWCVRCDQYKYGSCKATKPIKPKLIISTCHLFFRASVP